MNSIENTKNLFIRTYRRIKQWLPQPALDRLDPDNWEMSIRGLAENILEDVYQDIVNKMCDQLEQLDVNTMDNVTLQVQLPGENSPKYLKVKILELDELLMQIAGKLRATELRPYRAYED